MTDDLLAAARALLAKWETEDDECPGWFMREYTVGMNRTTQLRELLDGSES